GAGAFDSGRWRPREHEAPPSHGGGPKVGTSTGVQPAAFQAGVANPTARRSRYHSQNFSTNPSVNGEYGPGSYAELLTPACARSTNEPSWSLVAVHTEVNL